MTQALTVIKITNNKSKKTGADFKTVEFTAMSFLGGKPVKSNLSGTRNIWDKRTITLQDGTTQEVKADPLFNGLAVGDLVSGRIVKVDTTDYDVNGRTVNSWKGVVFEGEDAIKYANSQLKANNAKVQLDGLEVESEADLVFSNKGILEN